MTMQWARNLILVGLAIVSYLMILAWQKDYGSTSPSSSAEQAVNRSVDASTAMNLPESPSLNNSDVPVVPTKADLPITASAPTQGLLQVKTDVLDVKIDTLGGDIVGLSLPTYTKTVDSKEPFTLLENNRQRMYCCTVGLNWCTRG
jgi:YidC/Oxa1 family membrane protein insertase